MKMTQIIKGLGSTALVAAALVFSSSANADPVTQLIHFDDANNGWSWYSDKDNNFLFDPTNLNSPIHCADPTTTTGSANGSCVLEGKGQNGLLPTMTRPKDGPYLTTDDRDNGVIYGEAIGSPNAVPVISDPELDLLFTLDSFYFLLNGEGGKDGINEITVTGSNGESFTFGLNGTYAGPLASAPVVTFYEGPNAGGAAGALVKDTGYIATFGAWFEDVSSITWSAPSSAQLRLDCVVATFDGTTTESLSSYKGGCGGGTQVPEPATLGLLGIGLFGMGLMRRRRKV